MDTSRKAQTGLGLRAEDYVAAAAKSLVGAVPFAGSLLVEIAGTIIPNQRLDRIAAFARNLEAKLAALERDFVRSQLTNESFTDLMEEGLRQAAQSLSDERREQIASLIANSLDTTQVSYSDSKHLLRVLGELNDVEVIRLAWYQHETMGEGSDFWERHKAILDPVNATFGAAQAEIDRETLQVSYDAHLQQLGLLKPHYNVDRKTGQVQIGISGDLEIGNHSLSSFGQLLLRHVGILDPAE